MRNPVITMALAATLVFAGGPMPASADLAYRRLPSAMDMFETWMYWMRDYSGAENPYDPASVLSLMEEQAARYFDFGVLASVAMGPDYWAEDVLRRSHIQHQLRDWLFTRIAEQMGLLDGRPPHYRPLVPRRIGPLQWRVGGEILHPPFAVVRLEFLLTWTWRGWRVYDVSSNGMRASEFLRAWYTTHGMLPSG